MCNIKEHKEQDSKSLKYMTFIILPDGQILRQISGFKMQNKRWFTQYAVR